VEMVGTLYEDHHHYAEFGPTCWSGPFHNHDGWLEIHPVDRITRLPSPGSCVGTSCSPQNDALNSARAGIKRTVGLTACNGPTPYCQSSGHCFNSPTISGNIGPFETVCPEGPIPDTLSPPATRVPPQPLLQAHVLQLIDSNFSIAAVDSKSSQIIRDCVALSPSAAPGSFIKQTYVVWWTPAPSCPDNYEFCGETCVNVMNDPKNCGACGIVCPTGTCNDGQCACNPGLTWCSPVCTNTNTDPNNCGSCGTVCDPDNCETCVKRSCRSSCNGTRPVCCNCNDPVHCAKSKADCHCNL
jgi:hypothetical protein